MSSSSTVHRVAQALRTLLPKELPPSLSEKSGNLYQILSRSPSTGRGKFVFQTRWQNKGIHACYWEVTDARFKEEGRHGKAWGKLYWKGKLVSGKPERIRGALKYRWQEGIS